MKELMERPTLDKLKEYRVYLTNKEKEALAHVQIDCSTYEDSVLAGIVHQIFYEDESLDNYD